MYQHAAVSQLKDIFPHLSVADVKRTLAECNWDINQAAAALFESPSTRPLSNDLQQQPQSQLQTQRSPVDSHSKPAQASRKKGWTKTPQAPAAKGWAKVSNELGERSNTLAPKVTFINPKGGTKFSDDAFPSMGSEALPITNPTAKSFASTTAAHPRPAHLLAANAASNYALATKANSSPKPSKHLAKQHNQKAATQEAIVPQAQPLPDNSWHEDVAQQLAEAFPWAGQDLVKAVLVAVNHDLHEAATALTDMAADVPPLLASHSAAPSKSKPLPQATSIAGQPPGRPPVSQPSVGIHSQDIDDEYQDTDQQELYRLHRKDAMKLTHAWCKLMRRAGAAFEGGDHSEGRRLALEARRVREQAAAAHEEAAGKIEAAVNAGRGLGLYELDLHGLHAREAITSLERRLTLLHSRAHLPTPQSSSPPPATSTTPSTLPTKPSANPSPRPSSSNASTPGMLTPQTSPRSCSSPGVSPKGSPVHPPATPGPASPGCSCPGTDKQPTSTQADKSSQQVPIASVSAQSGGANRTQFTAPQLQPQHTQPGLQPPPPPAPPNKGGAVQLLGGNRTVASNTAKAAQQISSQQSPPLSPVRPVIVSSVNPGELKVVVGRGTHSKDGEASLPRVVEGWLMEHGYQYFWRTGMVVVKLRKPFAQRRRTDP